MRLKLLIIFSVILNFQSNAFSKGNGQRLAVAQGVSLPSPTSTINFSNGFTIENPVGVIYQTDFRLTGQYASGTSDSFGAELGVGNGNYGFALGYYDNNCTDCAVSGALAGTLAGVGIGLGFDEDLSSLGMIFNPNGKSRVGLVAGMYDPTGNDNNITSFGLGYAYIGGDLTFSIDASKRIYEDAAAATETTLVTPGLLMQFSMLTLSVSYDVSVNTPTGTTNSDNLWLGLGFDGGSWNMAFYSDYVSDFSFAGTLYF